MNQVPPAPPSSSYCSTPGNSEEALDQNSERLERTVAEEEGSSNGSDTYESATTTATVLRLPRNQEETSRDSIRDSGSNRGWSVVKRQSAYSTSTSKNSQRNSMRSLIKQERARLDSSHSHFHYNKHALQESDHISIEASTTGNDPLIGFSSIFVDPKDIASPRASSTIQNARSFFREDFTSSGSGGRAGVTRKSVQSFDASEGNEVTGASLYNNRHRVTIQSPNGAINAAVTPNNHFPSSWTIFCRFVTILILPSILRMFGLTSKRQQEAWREKVGLNFIILLLTALVGFCTLGLSRSVCNDPAVRIHHTAIPSDSIVIHGRIFNISNFNHPPVISHPEGLHGLAVSKSLGATDGSLLFQNVNSQCKGLILPDKTYTNVQMDKFGRVPWYFPCTTLTFDGRFIEPPIQKLVNRPRHNITVDFSTQDPQYGCHLQKRSRRIFYTRMLHYGNVYYNWEDLDSSPRNLIVYHGDVIDLDRLKLLIPMRWRLAPELRKFILPNILLTNPKHAHPQQKDLSLQMVSSKRARKVARCLLEIAKVGVVDTDTLGCITSSLVLILSVVFICSIVITKFLFAVYFEWCLSWRMGIERNWNDQIRDKLIVNNKENAVETPQSKTMSSTQPSSSGGMPIAITTNSTDSESDPDLQLLMVQKQPVHWKYVICLVTVYSETVEGLRQTLNGLVETDYPQTHKLLMVICDGMVTGSENNYTTPDVVLSMMEDFIYQPDTVKECFYAAVASGAQRINMAKVYCGYYQYQSGNSMGERPKIPMVAIIKCGLQEESRTSSKPGNRGKRDSQIILMSFLQKVMFEERMTDLENEMYLGIFQLMNESKPDIFEAVLMVDADTKVYPDSLRHMVRCLDRDSSIMGLCGETKIENKQDSWVTMIQVFEYFISHHYTKSFESIFGGVTCLPGCFCMYRIKAPKGPDGYWVPILANPDVVERYSMNIVDSLHRKNLLLLGEDRYLSTLMLKSFSQRRQVFVPQAKCKTVVPTEFKVLLDQRRRWINSTIHNLLELLLVRDLCGVFCISMQFVVFIELMGTVTLPAALVFTIYLFVSSTINSELPIIPITLLTLILGIPAVLIVVTGHKWVYLGWMFIYILSLPVWNFILPLNACKATPGYFSPVSAKIY